MNSETISTARRLLVVLASLAQLTVPCCGRTHLTGDASLDDEPAESDGDLTPCIEDTGCNDGDPCTTDLCEEGSCLNTPIDLDGDGHVAALVDGVECGDDCNDNRADVYPGATEVCLDGVDQDCDTVIDGFTTLTDEILLAGDDQVSWNPDIVWTGSEFGVAWWNAGTIDALRNEVYFTRLDYRGSLVGEPIIENDVEDVSTESASRLSLAWTGSEFGLAWETPYYDDLGYISSFIEFAHLNADGTKMGEDIVIARGPSDGRSSYFSPILAWTGSQYGIAYSFDAEVFFALLDPEGHRIGEEIQVTNWPEDNIDNDLPSLIWTGSDFGLTWRHAIYPLFDFSLGFTKLALDGDRLIGDVLLEPVGGFYNSSLVWSGSMFAASWDGFFSVFDSIGTPLADIIEIPGEPAHDAYIDGPHGLVWTGSEYGMIVWGGPEDSHYYYHIALPDGTGQIRIIQISTGIHFGASAITWTGSTIGAVWQTRKDDSSLHDLGDITFRLIGNCD